MPTVFELNSTAADNTDKTKGGWPEGMNRDEVNDQARDNTSALRAWIEDAEWLDLLKEQGNDFTVQRVDTDTFRIIDSGAANPTTKFPVGLWVKVTGTGGSTVVYGKIASVVAYSAPNLDVTLDDMVDAAYASSSLPSSTVTKVECYLNRRIKAAAFSPTGKVLAQTPPEIPTADDLGSAAFLDDGDVDAATLEGSDLAAVTAGDIVLHENYVTNGEMQVWQRGTSIHDTSEFPNEDGAYTADCMVYCNSAGGTADIFDIAQELTNVPAGFRSALSLECLSGGGTQKAGIVHYLEGLDSRPIVGTGKASASFYAAISASASITTVRAAILAFTAPGVEDVFASPPDIVGGAWGGVGVNPIMAANWGTPLNTTTALTTSETWARFEIPDITVAAATLNLALFIWIDDVSYSVGDKLYLTGLQLEPGAKVTDYRHRMAAHELQLCQRRCWSSYNLGVEPGTVTDVGKIYHPSSDGVNFAAGQAHWDVRHPTRMRATPSTVRVYAPGTGNVAHVTNDSDGDRDAVIVNAGEMGFGIHQVTDNPSLAVMAAHVFASADL